MLLAIDCGNTQTVFGLFDGDRLTSLRYSEPAADLIPVKDRRKAFSSGTGPAAPPPADETPPS